MSTISAVINTFNEEANIERCLRSLLWCDEIIVVDMMSSDRTKEISRRYTPNFFEVPNVGFADPAREFAVSKATSEWILIIDADELVPKTLADRLTEISNDPKSKDVYWIPLKNYLFGDWIQYTGWGLPDYHCRFFRKNSMRFSSDIHAFLEPIGEEGYLPPKQEFSLQHFNYVSISEFVTKLNRYTTIEAVQRFDRGQTYSVFRTCVIPIRIFVKKFILEKGFRDRWRGFALSMLMGIYYGVVYLKVLERKRAGSEADIKTKYNALKEEIIREHCESN